VEVPPYGDVAEAVTVAGAAPQPVNPPTGVTVKVIGLEASLVGAFVVDTVMVSLVWGERVAPPAMVVVAAGAVWTMVSVTDAPVLASCAVTVAVPAVAAGVYVVYVATPEALVVTTDPLKLEPSSPLTKKVTGSPEMGPLLFVTVTVIGKPALPVVTLSGFVVGAVIATVAAASAGTWVWSMLTAVLAPVPSVTVMVQIPDTAVAV
jgi:hypothetical protein